MIKAIPMEDWLRGCIYHDGRHGYVTLPIDKVHQIANYIQRTRRSGTDGLIDLKVVEADRKTENKSEIPTDSDEPQTELVNDSPILVKDLVDDEFNPYDEECMRCKHLKLKCEFVPSYCKYEPRAVDWKDEMRTEAVEDEPQAERRE